MLKNFKMIHKITLLSSVLLIFAFIVGFSGYYFTQHSNANLSSMHNNDLKAINLMDDVRLQLRTCQYDLSNVILNNGDKEAQQFFLDELDSKFKGISTDITEYKKLDLTQDQKDTIADIESNMPNFVNVCKKIIDMSSTGSIKTEDINTYFADNKDNIDGFRSTANALLKAHVASTDNTYSSNEAANKKSIVILLTMLTIALILGIVITILIAKPITSSLGAATNCLGIFATGDFTHCVPKDLLNNKDEIGLMLKAMDKMQKSIR